MFCKKKAKSTKALRSNSTKSIRRICWNASSSDWPWNCSAPLPLATITRWALCLSVSSSRTNRPPWAAAQNHLMTRWKIRARCWWDATVTVMSMRVIYHYPEAFIVEVGIQVGLKWANLYERIASLTQEWASTCSAHNIRFLAMSWWVIYLFIIILWINEGGGSFKDYSNI